MNYSSKWEQIRLYFGKCWRGFINDSGWKSLIGAVVIPLLILLVTGDDVFLDSEKTKQWAFTVICACLWLGLFNSITSICKERDIIKHEYRAGMYFSSYIIAHMFFEMIICAIEAIAVSAINLIRYWNNFQNIEGSTIIQMVVLTLTFFLTIYAADTLSILISTIVKNPVTAMYVMPFVLIFQLIFAGMFFELDGVSREIARLTLSKWGYEAVLSITKAEQDYWWLDYTHTRVASFPVCWIWLIFFTVIYAILACRLLRRVEKDQR